MILLLVGSKARAALIVIMIEVYLSWMLSKSQEQ